MTSFKIKTKFKLIIDELEYFNYYCTKQFYLFDRIDKNLNILLKV